MASATSPTIRARNAKYQGNVTKRGTAATKKPSSSATKPTGNTRAAYFMLALLFGGVFFQILFIFFGEYLFPGGAPVV
ncbi:hypothetical protein BGW41_005110 [Actinomortierella wolfii]|nr:hypothetical protein BGW41_005110 [Actinomortierella wolfii]